MMLLYQNIGDAIDKVFLMFTGEFDSDKSINDSSCIVEADNVVFMCFCYNRLWLLSISSKNLSPVHPLVSSIDAEVITCKYLFHLPCILPRLSLQQLVDDRNNFMLL